MLVGWKVAFRNMWVSSPCVEWNELTMRQTGGRGPPTMTFTACCIPTLFCDRLPPGYGAQRQERVAWH